MQMLGENYISKNYIQSGLGQISQGFWYAIPEDTRAVWKESEHSLYPTAEWGIEVITCSATADGGGMMGGYFSELSGLIAVWRKM